ncbi:MAG: glycosyltransferase family 4 protein [Acidimicrobiales bacterium]|nr:glycosyltransferase family 4 protein [Acidimicrobiales bacterium]MCB9393092.1 glycosyltransferase family 4 protein [Acidimicrobiaceae bacterium]
MRVLMLSWEYPPFVVGGIAAHVDGLARAMARQGHDVVVCTLQRHEPGSPDVPDDEIVDGVRVLRATADLPWLPEGDLVARMASANHQLVGLAARLGAWRPEVVHAHDWLVSWAGDTLKALFAVPLVATVHATERGRHGGHVPPGMPAAINAVEWWLTYQAREVIACSRFMVREVVSGFELPVEKVHLVPNGVDPALWQLSGTPPAREPLVVAWGRVQYEKGFQVLVRAIAELRQRLPEVRCVIAGRGSYLPELQSQIDVEGVADVVDLAGFVPDDDLRRILQRAGCVIIPSLYEPFGIVALEGMAAGAPTIVARTGGLAEIVEGTGAGLLFEPGNHHDLAARIESVLRDPTLAGSMSATAAELIAATYTWDAIATTTIGVYDHALR